MTRAFETREATRDGDRLAHNPEVAGSNPVPATCPRYLSPLPGKTALGDFSGGRFHARWERVGNISIGQLTIVFVA